MQNGKTIVNKDEILREQEVFYAKLYSSKTRPTEDQEQFFFNDNIPKLSEIQKEQCKGMITEQELLKGLKNTQNNKSPGSDGYPCAFYKVFWVDIKTHLVEALNYAFDTNSLSITQKQGVIILLPEQGRDPLYLNKIGDP